MKRIILVRHAKADWEYNHQSDFDRPLNGKGANDAPRMAVLLKKQVPNIDLFISSSAARTMETASIFAEHFNYQYQRIVSEYSLYLADYITLKKYISTLESHLDTVILFGHNPGITELACDCSGKYLYNLPTCAYISMKLPSDRWQDIMSTKCDIEFFEYPSSKHKR